MDGRVRSAQMDIVEQRTLKDNLYRVTIAANEGVRQPPDLDFGGLSTENYARNPVVMWAHDAVGRSPSGGLPVGRTLSLTKAPGGRISAEFEFLSDDPFAQRVKNAWDKGFIRAASISWLPIESVPGEGGRWKDSRSELLEWSIVAVPADPDALREVHHRMVNDFLSTGPSKVLCQVSHEEITGGRQQVAAAPPLGLVGGQREPGASPSHYDDLVKAMTLLRGVVAELSPSEKEVAPPQAGAGTSDDVLEEYEGETTFENEIEEVAALVSKVHAVLADEGRG